MEATSEQTCGCCKRVFPVDEGGFRSDQLAPLDKALKDVRSTPNVKDQPGGYLCGLCYFNTLEDLLD